MLSSLPPRGIALSGLVTVMLFVVAPLHAADGDPLAPPHADDLSLESEVMVPDLGLALGKADAVSLTVDSPFLPLSPLRVTGPTVASDPPEPIVPPPLVELEVMLDWYPSPRHAALFVARERGLYERRGLDVTLSTPADPNVPTKLLAAGRVELAVSRQPLLHLQVGQGMPLIRVATLIEGTLTGVVSREELEIDSPADLAGRRLGHASQDSLALLDAALAPHGLHRGDLDIRDVNFGLGRAMREDEVDAVIGSVRHVLPRQLADEGVATRTLRLEELDVPLHDGLILLANRDELGTRREAIRDYVSALEEATAWILDHPDEAWILLSAAEPALDVPANRSAWEATLRHLSARPAAVDHGRYARFETFLHEANLVESVTPVERLAIDPGAP